MNAHTFFLLRLLFPFRFDVSVLLAFICPFNPICVRTTYTHTRGANYGSAVIRMNRYDKTGMTPVI